MSSPRLTVESIEHVLVPRLSLAHCSWTDGLQGKASAGSDWMSPSGARLRVLAAHHGARGPEDLTLRLTFSPCAAVDSLRPGDIIAPA